MLADWLSRVSLGDIAQVIFAIAALWTAVTSHRTRKAVTRVEHATNGMKAELVAVTRTAALAEGVKKGHEEANAEKQAK